MGVYTEYFQKSKVFLYPLLEIRKGVTHVPVQTYVAWEGVYSIEDSKFFCEYNTKMTQDFQRFAYSYLHNHKLFEKYIELNKKKHLFIFDFYSLKPDFKRFLSGNYSKFSLNSKITILDFFSSQQKISSYVNGFLSPETVHEEYANALSVDIDLIKNIYEVCDLPNINKEILIDNSQLISDFKKSSISLTNSKL